MFTHYLKIAFRNLTKYKTQTIISIIGLAVGFVCFALSALWIRYERSFDTFHPNSQSIYVALNHGASTDFGMRDGRFMRNVPKGLAAYMRETFPEVKNATAISHPPQELRVEGVPISHHGRWTVDEAFFEMFNVRVLEGHIDFNRPQSNTVVITAPKARQLFGNENPIGRTITGTERDMFGSTTDMEYTIVAIVSSWSGPSNFPYDMLFIRSNLSATEWLFGTNVLFQLYRGVNVDAFLERIENHIPQPFIERRGSAFAHAFSAVPLTTLRTNDDFISWGRIRHQYILLFSLAGLLVILCVLFNYFTLFFSRFKIRQKEFALRMVCGATFKSLFSLLATEFLMIMLIASALGLLMTHLFQSGFQELSRVDMNLSAVMGEVSLYFFAIVLLALLVFFLLLFIFKKRSLNASIRKSKNSNARKLSIVLQLIISIVFIFCTSVMIRQLNYLHRADNLGIDFTRTSVFSIQEDASVIESKLNQIPEIEQFFVDIFSFFPRMMLSQMRVDAWDGKDAGSEEVIVLDSFLISEALQEFYSLQLVAGEFLSDGDDMHAVLINETAARAFGWYDPVGKAFSPLAWGTGIISHYRVKGVIRDIQYSPTVPVQPAFFYLTHWNLNRSAPSGRTSTPVIIRYQEGQLGIIDNKIREMFDERFLSGRLGSTTEIHAQLLVSENALLRLLGFVSLICILISVFGFFSLVSLTCEERRKEIAIRKINGATIHDIVGIFFKEYALLLATGALIAFPIGYYIMQRWLEQYVLQTAIPMWIYVAILLALTLVIVSCVGWRVWKASIENPADVIKAG